MKKISVLGTGLMGKPIAKRLCKLNNKVFVYNRTKININKLDDEITIVNNIQEIINNSEVSILTLSDYNAISELLFSKKMNYNNHTFINMSTISPSESINLKESISKFGGEYFESPMQGSIPEADSGKLILMVGATKHQFNKWKPLLSSLGQNPKLIGEVGQAASLKLALNQLLASLTLSFSLALSFLRYYEVDINIFMKVLRETAVYAPTFDKKLPRMLSRNFENPNFPTKHLAKDINLFLKCCESANINTEIVEKILETIIISINDGNLNNDYSSLYNAICMH